MKYMSAQNGLISGRQGRAQGADDAHQAEGPAAVRHARPGGLQPGGRREGRQEDGSQVRPDIQGSPSGQIHVVGWVELDLGSSPAGGGPLL